MFGEISGYKVNNSKSSIMLLNRKERGKPNMHAGKFKLSDNFTYLGIKITEIDKMVFINYI